MGFKFKLDSVLTYTLSKEETIKQEYMKVVAQQKRAIERMSLLREELVKDIEAENIDISLLIARSTYNDRITYLLQQQVEIVEALNNKVQWTKSNMIEILKERKTLEKLKEKHKEEYRKNQASLEQKFLDEQAILAFHRN